jgi:hypothetical protein
VHEQQPLGFEVGGQCGADVKNCVEINNLYNLYTS